jgi:hypothetical protein
MAIFEQMREPVGFAPDAPLFQELRILGVRL